jgi:hypothetical protein
MSLRDDFLDMLAPTFTWVPIGPGRYLVTEYMGVKLPAATLLLLDERLFDRYVEWLIRRAGDESLDDALGTVYFALDDALTSAPAEVVVTEVGLRTHLRQPVWFATRVTPEVAKTRPHTAWVGDLPL